MIHFVYFPNRGREQNDSFGSFCSFCPPPFYLEKRQNEQNESPRSRNKVGQNTFKNTPEDDLDTFCGMISHITSKYRLEFLGTWKIAGTDRSGLWRTMYRLYTIIEWYTMYRLYTFIEWYTMYKLYTIIEWYTMYRLYTIIEWYTMYRLYTMLPNQEI